MQPNRKRPNALVRWLKKNTFYIFLLIVVLVSMFLGGFIYSLFDKNTPSKTTESSTSSVVETQKETDKLVDTNKPIVTPTESQSAKEEVVFYYNVPLSHDLQDHIRTLCNEYEVPMELVIAVVDIESSFRPTVISVSDDYGYMQINKINHEELSEILGITDFLDPYENLQAGIYFLGGHLQRTDGDIVKALMRYNNGPTGALQLWNEGIYSTEYTQKVMSRYEFYQKESRSDAGTP